MTMSPGSASSSVFSRMLICQPPSGGVIRGSARRESFKRSASDARVSGSQRPARLIHDARQDAPQPLHIAWMQVHVINGGREGGVMQGLQALLHIPHDLKDNLPRGDGIGSGRTVHGNLTQS